MATGDWKIRDSLIGNQDIEATSTTQNHPLGTIVKANHDSKTTTAQYGEAEFIYLVGVASTVANDWVFYNADDFSSTRLVADSVGPVGIAMSANVASQWGWYMIHGKHPNASVLTAVADGAQLFITGTAAALDDTSVAGDHVFNVKTASSTGDLVREVEIQRPFVDNGLYNANA